MIRHRWIPSSLVASTCSRCGLRCTYRGPEVRYGASSLEPRCRPPVRKRRRMQGTGPRAQRQRLGVDAAPLSIGRRAHIALAEMARRAGLSINAMADQLVSARLKRLGTA